MLSTATLDGTGRASFTLTSLSLGTHGLTASYAGDGNNFPGASPVLTESVQLNASQCTLTSSLTTVVLNQPFTLTATLQGSGPVPPTGTIVFSAGGTTLGSAPLNASGVATLTTPLALGTYTVIATYAGDAIYAGCASGSVAVSVVPPTSFSMALTPSSMQLQSTQHSTIQLTLTSHSGVQRYPFARMRGPAHSRDLHLYDRPCRS